MSLEFVYLVKCLLCVLIIFFFFLLRLCLCVFIHQPVPTAVLLVGVVWATPLVGHAHHAPVKRHR